MSFSRLLHCLHDVLVNTKTECDWQNGQWEVCNHTEYREYGQREEDEEHAAENNSCFFDIPPVYEIQNCKNKRENLRKPAVVKRIYNDQNDMNDFKLNNQKRCPPNHVKYKTIKNILIWKCCLAVKNVKSFWNLQISNKNSLWNDNSKLSIVKIYTV